jgi:porphobilinogen synthase
MTTAQFPSVRTRRIRQSPWVRDLFAEVSLAPKDFILPLFVREESISPDIAGMPDVRRLTLHELEPVVMEAMEHGIKAVMLFPAIDVSKKREDGNEALNSDNIICKAISHIKAFTADIGIVADVALDPYTTHGHDGILVCGEVHNDLTLEILMKQANVLANAGADVIAPSDMMDGRVGRIRTGLDEAGFNSTQIWSYSAKFASAFYGPFRSAMQIRGLQGPRDKKSYQLDPRSPSQALRRMELDVWEGADALIVKPGLPYLDIAAHAANHAQVPIISYLVSGEYAMLKAAAQNGWVNYELALMEQLIACKRAGVSNIITYSALDAAKILRN